MDNADFRERWEKIAGDLEQQETGETFKGNISSLETLAFVAVDKTLSYAQEQKTVIQESPHNAVADETSQQTLVLQEDSASQQTLVLEEQVQENSTSQQTLVLKDKEESTSLACQETITNAKENGALQETILAADTMDYQKTMAKQTAIENEALSPSPGYKIQELIAQGGMGVVYKGTQNSLQREIAIKKSQSNNENLRQKFLSEALVTAHLDHPNIVPVYEIFMDHKSELSLTMKLVKGICWKDILHPKTLEHREKAQQYNLEGHLRILLDVCHAIAFAHDKGIVHNDLKPANIMLGEFGEVLVMDWGIAVDVTQQPPEKMKTIHKSMISEPMGTCCYIAPELAEGMGENIGPWTDTYLLGGILYEILTGGPPHTGKTIWEILVKVRTGTQPHLTPTVAQSLQKICYKALAHDIEKRYKNVHDFTKDIDLYLEHRESIVITEQAQKELEKACALRVQKKPLQQVYYYFSQAVAGFTQALNLWQDNLDATEKLYQTHLNYARIAVANGDLGLAQMQLSLLDSQRAEVIQLSSKIKAIKEKKQKEQIMAQRLRRGIIAITIAIIVVLATAVVLISQEKKQTEKQRVFGLINQGEAFVLAKRWKNARESYAKAITGLQKLAISPFIAQVKIWNTYHYSPLPILSLPHQSSVNAAVFTREGIATATDKGKIILWDLETAQQKFTLSCPGSVLSLAVYNNLLASAGPQGIVIWNLTTKQKLFALKKSQSALSISYADNGKILASGHINGKVILWNIRQQKPLFTFLGHEAEVFSVAMCKDNKYLVSGSGDWTVKLWDIEQKKLIYTQEEHSNAVLALAVSKDSKFLLSGDLNQTIYLSELKSGKALQSFTGHTAAIKALQFTSKGQEFISASWDNMVKLWSIPRNKELMSFSGHEAGVQNLALCTTGQFLSTSADATVKWWDTNNTREIQMIVAHRDYVVDLAISSCAKLALSCSNDGSIKLWDIATGQLLQTFLGHSAPVTTIAFSQDRKNIISGSHDGHIKLWNTKTGQQMQNFKAMEPISNVAFLPREDKLVSLGKSMIIWDKGTAKKLYSGQKSKEFLSLAMAKKSQKIIAGAADNKVYIWNFRGKLLSALDKQGTPVLSIAISKDEKKMATGGFSAIQLWDLAQNKLINTTKQRLSPVLSLDFSPDGKWILAASQDKICRLWSSDLKKVAHSFSGHLYAIHSAKFSPQNDFFISVSSDTTLRIWNFARYKSFQKFIPKLQKLNTNASSLKTLGNWYAFRGFWKLATKYLQQAKEQGEKISALSLARCYWHQKKLKRALFFYQEALKQEKRYDIELCIEKLKKIMGSKNEKK